MLRLEALEFRYSKHSQAVLRGLSLELGKGQVGVLLGRNGSGKTTLFKNILGLLRPTSGSITFDGQDLIAMPPRVRASIIAHVPQDIHFGGLTVFDSVLLGRISRFVFRAGKEDQELVWKVLEDMGLEDLALRNVEELSGGERQKVAIARALAQEPAMLVLDEPTGNLDIANGQLIIEEARRLAEEKGITVLCALHDLNQALAFGDSFFFLKDGVLVHQGGEEVMTADVVKECFGIDVDIVEVEGRKVVIGGKRK